MIGTVTVAVAMLLGTLVMSSAPAAAGPGPCAYTGYYGCGPVLAPGSNGGPNVWSSYLYYW